MSLIVVLKLFGAMSLLIYGMKVMSEALQKMAGPQLRGTLAAMTANRFAGVASGALVTVAVQSSTATTVMTVSFVSAGLLTLAQAISVIMGANIGTTLTAWIMSAGFSFNISDLVWPAFFIGIILIYIRRWRYTGDFLYGLAFMLLSLAILKATGTEMNLAGNPAVVDFFASFDPTSFLTILLFLFAGTVLTFLVHSSAAVMAITMILCSSGVLPIYQGIALVMGENIGTTLTANIAALAGNTQARRTAMAHLFFNVFGVLWVLVIFRPFVDFACSLVGLNPGAGVQEPARLSFALAAFHTLFNVINTCILIWFVPQIEKIVCMVVRPRAGGDTEDFQLHYIHSGIMRTPEISLIEASKEIIQYAHSTRKMLGLVKQMLHEKDLTTLSDLGEKVQNSEQLSDNMEMQIGEFLRRVSDAHLSDQSKEIIRRMLNEISGIESIGDSCFSMARTLLNGAKETFTDAQMKAMEVMLDAADRSLCVMTESIDGPNKGNRDVSENLRLRQALRRLRNESDELNCRESDARNCSYAAATVFMDFINRCDDLGNQALGVVEARIGYKLEEDAPLTVAR